MTSLQSLALSYLATLLVLAFIIREVQSVGCFVCSSINGSEPECEDTFSNDGSRDYYEQNCKAGRKGRDGVFPATACVKMKAELGDGSFRLMVRQCVTDNGDINEETELARSNHCGLVQMLEYNDQIMYGCVVSCHTNGCNDVGRPLPNGPLLLAVVLSGITAVLLRP